MSKLLESNVSARITYILGSSLDDAQEIATAKIRASKLRMDVGKTFNTSGATSVSFLNRFITIHTTQ